MRLVSARAGRKINSQCCCACVPFCTLAPTGWLNVQASLLAACACDMYLPGLVSGAEEVRIRLSLSCRGQIRFARKGEGRCTVKLTISYEVPSVLAPFASVSRGNRALSVSQAVLQLLCILVNGRHSLINPPLPFRMVPALQLLRPVVEGILQTDMRRFAEYAVQQQQGRSATA